MITLSNGLWLLISHRRVEAITYYTGHQQQEMAATYQTGVKELPWG